MKTRLYILAFSLLSGLGLSQGYAQYGKNNTFLGKSSGYKNTSGSYNTFLGHRSGFHNTTGSLNTFLGFDSGFNNSTASFNTFLGTLSGYSNTLGNRSTFLGYSSGYSNTTGYNNTFLGFRSGYSNTTGSNNTFIGHSSGDTNATGSGNTLVGYSSGKKNISGKENTFLGNFSGYNNTFGSSNTFLGHSSGRNNINGERNVFIGYKAGYSETGSYKLYIDNNDDNRPLLYGNFSANVLSIGSKYMGTVYQLVVPGKVRAAEYWVQYGRGDIKVGRTAKQDNPLKDALAKVQKVEAMSFAPRGVSNRLEVVNADAIEGQAEDTQMTYGFVAETVQQVFPELVLEEEGEIAINYQGMIPVLVEAIKELAIQKDFVTKLQAKVEQLQQEVVALRRSTGKSKSIVLTETALDTQLYQNYPNPFDQSTTIRYQVATEARQVSLLITDLQGIIVHRFDHLPVGQGELVIPASSLGAGSYVYTLLIDGKPVASRKMNIFR